MKISSFKYYVGDSLKSLWRNKTIGFASTATVAATLFVMGVFLLTALNVQKGVSGVEDQVEIKVFLDKGITFSQQREIEAALKGAEGVKEVVFESEAEALRKFTEQISEKDRTIFGGYDSSNNPLPSSFIVKLVKPEMAEAVVNKVKDMEGIDTIGNDRELIQNIIAISKAIRWIGVAIFAMLVGVSLFLIGNTIRLTVFSRRREIGIMKFVGATDWFIRWPFVIEGMIIGLLGGVVANVLLYYAYSFTFATITESFFAVQLIGPSYIINTISWQFLLAGGFIGSMGSIIALRKFLAV